MEVISTKIWRLNSLLLSEKEKSDDSEKTVDTDDIELRRRIMGREGMIYSSAPPHPELLTLLSSFFPTFPNSTIQSFENCVLDHHRGGGGKSNGLGLISMAMKQCKEGTFLISFVLTNGNKLLISSKMKRDNCLL